MVVLAGDIGQEIGGINWAKKTFPDKLVAYVAGNHEYYSGDISDAARLKQRAEQVGIHFLEREAVVLGGVRFLG